ncbi:MAG: LamG domain-containing protein [Candidatus Micrarchaeia archaeon]
MDNRGQGSFEYVLMIAGVVLVLTVIVVVLQNQAVGSSQAVEQNVEHHEQVACDAGKMRELASSLILSWGFNEGKGVVAKDSSGGGNDGNLLPATGGPKWVVGRFRKALEFDGRNDYVEIPVLLSPTEAITVSAWVKSADSMGYSGIWQIVSKYDAFILGNSGGGSDMCFIVYTAGLSWADYTNCFTVSDPQNWHHFAGTYDSSTNEQKLFVDGVLRSTKTVTGTINPDSGPLHVAHRELNSPGDFHFEGSVDEVKIYDRALSQEEVLSDMNCGLLS